MRQTIAIKGASEHNLKQVSLEIPRDQLVVMTGVSGSGKSSLAFDTIYAEGQRLLLESLSSYSRRFVSQLKKPAVDLILGLSPVIAIEQKSLNRNPRSTVGTMTDIADYLRMLFATIGQAHCPYCSFPIPFKTPRQMAEHLLSLPEGTRVEITAPINKIFGEDLAYLFAEIKSKGYRKVLIDGKIYDTGEEIELDEGHACTIQVIIDSPIIKQGTDKQLLASLTNGLSLGQGFLSFHVLTSANTVKNRQASDDLFGCPEHQVVAGELSPAYFSFNDPESACTTCLGLGTYWQVHPDLLVPDKKRSITRGAFIPEAFTYDKNSWTSRMIYSLASYYHFSLETPFENLPSEIVDLILYGTGSEKIPLMRPEGVTRGEGRLGKAFHFEGIIPAIERRYRHYRKEQVAHTNMETYLRKVMVEHICPDCAGRRLRSQRFLMTINGNDIYALGEMNIKELSAFLNELPDSGRQQKAGQQILAEISARLLTLQEIGLEYLNLNRRALTLSGGEAQRLRLSTQISSELMGMLYVLDEPSIGLHPRDTLKVIATLKRLRDLGNTVIVVEHDEETIRAADHIIEVGPGPGLHGGRIVAQGSIAEILQNPDSLTGQYLSGRKKIPVPGRRRQSGGQALHIRGARENNLKNIDVVIPLGVFLCITGVSGSGKSSLVNEILYKKLYSIFQDSRVLPGAHDALEGIEYIRNVINIDQSPIGRTSTSNPATFIGVYDEIRQMFASTVEAMRRGYSAARFSFNLKGGRCEECGGQGIITTHLHFLPDVETPCQACNGTRYTPETLEIYCNGKNIAEVLDLSIDDAVAFFEDRPLIERKLRILKELGLGYLKLGQSSKTLSGGEAQRVKLAYELGKVKRGGHTLYILDEPTTGLHVADISRLLDSLNRLVDADNSVIVIEHHLDVIKTADFIIELGPEGGKAGGQIVCQGTPEEVVCHPTSQIGCYLKSALYQM